MANGWGRGDDADVIEAAPPRGARLAVAVWVVVLLDVIVQVVVARSVLAWVALALAVAGSVAVVVVWLLQREDPPRLVADREGLRVTGFGVPRRDVPWSEVAELELGAAGPARVVGVVLATGRRQGLLRVREGDLPVLAARWQAVLAARGDAAPARGG